MRWEIVAMNNPYPIIAEGTKLTEGTVKWFSERLGYGFIEVDGEEVFIHRSTLNQFGLHRLLIDDIVKVTITNSARGQIVDTLFGIERRPVDRSLIANAPHDNEHVAYVKFFNETRGYGFVEVEGYDQDIFVHSRIIEQNGLSTIYTDQNLLVTIELGEKGYQIKTIRLLVDDTESDDTESDDTEIGDAKTHDD